MKSGASAAIRTYGAGLPSEAPALDSDAAWLLLLAIRARADQSHGGDSVAWGFCWAAQGWLAAVEAVADIIVDPVAAELTYCRWPFPSSARQLMGLLLGHALRSRKDGHVMALLGQSLDGFIATHHGDSRHINGPESLTYLH